MLSSIMSSENQLQSTITLLNHFRLLLLLFFAIISLIGTLDRYLPNLFPSYIKQLHNVKTANSNSRFLKLVLSLLELLSIVIWKVSSALFKFFLSIVTLLIVLVKKIALPFMEKTANSLEKTSQKIDEFSQKVENMSTKVEDMSYKMNDSSVNEGVKVKKPKEI